MSRRALLAFLLLATLCAAQESEPPAAEQEATAPVAIPLSDVTPRAGELGADLRRMEALLEPSEAFAQVGSDVDAQTAVMVELEQELDTIDPGRISRRMLADHRVRWSEVDENLSRSVSRLQTRWAELTETAEDLDRLRGTWAATRAQAVSEDAPPEILELIRSQLDSIAATNERLRRRAASVASELDRAVQRKQSSAEALERLGGIASEMRGRLFARDAPPIWRLAGSGTRTIIDDADEARRYWLDTLISYVTAHRTQFVLLLVCFTLFCLMGFATRMWSRSWPPEDAELERARVVVSRPISLALAFTLVVVVMFVNDPVGPLSDIIIFLALVPMVRLGVVVAPSAARVGFYGLAVLVAIDRLWTLAPDGSMLRRSLLFAVTAAALAGSVALMVTWRRSEESQYGAWWRFARMLVLLAGTLFASSLVANALGWSNLSQSITASTIESAFAAHAWLAVVLAAVALVPVAIRSPLGALLPSLRRHASGVSRLAFLVAAVLALSRWASTALQRLQLYDSVRDWFSTTLEASITIGGLEVSAGRVVASLSLLVFTWVTSRAVRFVLREEILPRLRLPAGAGHSVVSVANYVVWGSGILLAAAAAGLSGTQLTVVFGALGVGIGFGLQNVVGNFVSGLILIFERPIQVGDSVQTQDHLGIVTNIGIRASTIRTFDGAEVVVPNSDLVAKEFINWTRTDRTRRVEVRVRVALGTDPRTVLRILRDAAIAHEKVLADPAPSALMTGFGESSLDFRLLAWVRVEDFLGVSSDLHVAVNEELKSAGIEIPYPQRDVHVRSQEESPELERTSVKPVSD